ncbi:DUF4176 domain-containing protein [Anaeromicropila herbilytica]|uniref:DUF4176 domain-containing protein n=1 Tax=Anaeromicropila herbilytica TaxID=2785025 RepID=A0A7R7ICI8_9FIRM|nr:DUF4176 domain-containing protein [Anaeromicropila herbilytica]BCN29974.1 hypothetical protein bsdtb5_12690 [Anaeromicropila herbilytica]
MKKFLPIGSVVLLKGGEKKVMICGRVQQKVDTNEIFDYSACYYPEGILDAKELFLFNNDDIENVFYIGMQDEEEFKFRKYIIEELSKVESVSE